MKKSILVIIVIFLVLNPVFADEYEDVYDVVTPVEYSSLYVDGGLRRVSLSFNASNLEYNSEDLIQLTLKNGVASFNADMTGQYTYLKQTEKMQLNLSAFGLLEVGTATTGIDLTGNVFYTQFGLDVSGIEGFWSAGGSANLDLDTTSVGYFVNPVARIGIGRVYNISNVYLSKLMMEDLGVEPTPQKVEAVVSVIQKENEIKTQFSDNIAENYKQYYQELAQAMGIPDRVDDVMLLSIQKSQEYLYQEKRVQALLNGWNAYVSVSGNVEKRSFSPTTTYNGDIILGGLYSDFLLEERLYVLAGSTFFLNFSGTGSINVRLFADGRAIYLPDDYRMWGDARLTLGYSPSNSTKFTYDFAAAGYYLINPNFRVNAGISYANSTGLGVFGGGRIRIM